MDGYNHIKARNANPPRMLQDNVVPLTALKVPTEKVRQIITKLLDDIDHYTEVNLDRLSFSNDKEQIQEEICLATFRGAFIALKWSDDTITQVFADKALLAFSEGGLAAVRASLT